MEPSASMIGPTSAALIYNRCQATKSLAYREPRFIPLASLSSPISSCTREFIPQTIHLHLHLDLDLAWKVRYVQRYFDAAGIQRVRFLFYSVSVSCRLRGHCLLALTSLIVQQSILYGLRYLKVLFTVLPNRRYLCPHD